MSVTTPETDPEARDEPDSAPSDLAWERAKPVVRMAGTLILGALAVLALAFLGPSDLLHEEERRAIVGLNAANHDVADSAPQQIVVNGWTNNELLELISRQLDGPSPDERPAVLLTLGVLLIALRNVTAPAANPEPRRTGPLGEGADDGEPELEQW